MQCENFLDMPELHGQSEQLSRCANQPSPKSQRERFEIAEVQAAAKFRSRPDLRQQARALVVPIILFGSRNLGSFG